MHCEVFSPHFFCSFSSSPFQSSLRRNQRTRQLRFIIPAFHLLAYKHSATLLLAFDSGAEARLHNKDMQEDCTFYKIVLLGDSGVGKSNFFSRFAKNEFKSDSQPTIGVEFTTKSVVLEGQTVRVQLWDTAGQERYRAIISSYYRHAVGALLMYDICTPTSLENANLWLKELRMYASPNIVAMLIGNKTDLKSLRAIKLEEGASFAQRENIFFTETSAQDASHMETALHFLLLQIHQQLSQPRLLSVSYRFLRMLRRNQANQVAISK